MLVKHAGKVLTHNYIIKEVWGGVIGGENQSLRVFMANIRRKIEKEPANPRFLLTEVGVRNTAPFAFSNPIFIIEK